MKRLVVKCWKFLNYVNDKKATMSRPISLLSVANEMFQHYFQYHQLFE